MSSSLKRLIDRMSTKAAQRYKSVVAPHGGFNTKPSIPRDLDTAKCRILTERFVRKVLFHPKVDADSEFLMWTHFTMDLLRREISKGLSYNVLEVVKKQSTHLNEDFLLKNEDIDQIICLFLQEIDDVIRS